MILCYAIWVAVYVLQGVICKEMKCNAPQVVPSSNVLLNVYLHDACGEQYESKEMKTYLGRVAHQLAYHFESTVNVNVQSGSLDNCELPVELTDTLDQKVQWPQSNSEKSYTYGLHVVLANDSMNANEVGSMIEQADAVVVVLLNDTLKMEKQLNQMVMEKAMDKMQFTSVAVPNGNVMDIDIYKLVSAFGCGMYANAVQVRDAFTGRMSCQCHCKPETQTYYTTATTKICVPAMKESNSSLTCAWKNKCFLAKVVPEDGDRVVDTCRKVNVFSADVIPLPWDNYVFGMYNGNNTTPKVSVHLNGPNQKHIERDFEWIYFMKNAREILNSIEFWIEGKYTITIIASDWHQDTSCSAEIHLQDDFLPTSGNNVQCPTPMYHNTSIKSWPRYDAMSTIAKTMDNFCLVQTFASSRKDDACGVQADCDQDKLYVQNLQNVNAEHNFELEDADVCWKMSSKDLIFLSQLDILHEVPGEAAVKCWKRSVQFGEYVMKPSCSQPEQLSACRLHEKCELLQCIEAFGQDLYHAASIITAEFMSNSQTVMHQLNRTFDNLHSNFHFTIAEGSVGLAFHQGTFTFNLHQAISISTGLSNMGKEMAFQLSNGPISIIQCRYRLSTIFIWKKWKPPATETFTQPKTNVEIECWTSIGRVYHHVYTVHVHGTSPIDVCGDFGSQAFTSILGSASSTNTTHVEYCTLPHTNFVGIQYQLPGQYQQQKNYTFERISCEFYYLHHQDGPIGKHNRPMLLFNTTSTTTSYEYAIDLDTHPTTPWTSIEFNCALDYKNQHHDTNRQHCQHIVHLRDCEAPEFNPIYGNCSASCPQHSAKPHHLCQGNHISPTPTIASLLNSPTNCCSSCANSDFEFECLSFHPSSSTNASLGQCVQVKTISTITPDDAKNTTQPSSSTQVKMAHVGIGLFITLCILLSIIFVAAFKHHSDSFDEDGYRQLL